MWQTTVLFRQMQALIDHDVFDRIVSQFRGDRHVHFVDCWSHLWCLLWAQITGRVSLRDLEVHVQANRTILGPSGIVSADSSTVSRANRQRPWQIMAALCDHLLRRCLQLPASSKVDFPFALYSMDATVISLCKTVFGWAPFKNGKAGIKLHVLWNHRHGVPHLVSVTSANRREFLPARALRLPPGSFLCCDSGYIDFAWFHHMVKRGVHLLVNPRPNWTYAIVERRHRKRQSGIVFDRVVRLTGPLSQQKFPGLLRHVRYRDPQTKQLWDVMTTNLDLPAETIVALYRERWKIELFFKWIKQNLKIKTFFGTSYNAVMWQLYTAIAYYLMLVFLKLKRQLGWSLFQIHRIINAYLHMEITLDNLLRPQSNLRRASPHFSNT